MESASLETVAILFGAVMLAITVFGPLLNHKKISAEMAEYCRKVEKTLRDLSEVVGGEYIEAGHASELRLVRNGMDVCVEIGHDSSPNDGVYTTISVTLPPARAWRTPNLRYRKTPPADIDATSPTTFERYFAGAHARDIPEPVRKRLLQVAQQGGLMRLYDRKLLLFASVPDPLTGRRTFLTDAQPQQILLDMAVLIAADLIAG